MAMNGIVRSFVQRVVRSKMTWEDVFAEDGLYAVVCGSGSPLADARRLGPCIAISAGARLFFVDAGQGGTRNAQLMRLPLGRTDAVLLTHFHSDHIANLGELMLQRWVSGSNVSPVDVIGPVGVDQVVEGMNLAYRLDAVYRTAHHGPETAPPGGAGGVAWPLELSDDPDASAVVFDRDGVKITAFRVDHLPVDPAVGYRFDYKRRSVVISGDTVYSESLVEHAKGADVLFHDALNSEIVGMVGEAAGPSAPQAAAAIMRDIPSYHASPEDAARAATAAGVGRLVLYHVIPPVPRPLSGLLVADARRLFKGPVTLAEDGMRFFLPPDSARVEVRNLLG
jgi:ribonuclease Z